MGGFDSCFEWLARRLVKRERIVDIQGSLVKAATITPRAIGKAINELAQELELALPRNPSDA